MKLTKELLKEMIMEILDERKQKWEWRKFNCYVDRREEEMKMEKEKGKNGVEKPISRTTIVSVCDLKKVEVQN
tara:strand:+ start:480 stop:698 length:219 start_codon:yes stop_codon:yes gene_type:complete